MGYEFFGEKIIFPSAPVPSINNDQSLMYSRVLKKKRFIGIAHCFQITSYCFLHCLLKNKVYRFLIHQQTV